MSSTPELPEDAIIELRRQKRRKLMEHLASKQDELGDGLLENKLTDPDSFEIERPSRPASVPATEYNELSDKDRFHSEEESDDMFASSSSGSDHSPPVKLRKPSLAETGKELNQKLLDSWDDVDGYYRIISGELLDGRYLVTETLGKGMFAAVVRATDKQKNIPVAIKIIRNNETMKRAGYKEIRILEKLNEEGSSAIVKLLAHFEHKKHLCLVFENLHSNLRDVLKKYGRNVGISLEAVRSYCRQAMRGLAALKKCGIVHADLKPDNILVDNSRSLVKIADLGSASEYDDVKAAGSAPYLVSRFYRAPELILGLSHDYAVDMWSLGCSLFEMYTGRILFPGISNNNMLRHMMKAKGKFPHKMLRKSEFRAHHFNEQLDFQGLDVDKATGRQVFKVMKSVGPVEEMTIKARVFTDEADIKGSRLVLLQFVDLLEKMTALNPDKRITPEQALEHPFCN